MKCYIIAFSLFLLTRSLAQSPLVKQWDKRFGGTGQEYGDYITLIRQTNQGSYILGGSSFSGVGGDKTQPSWGLTDYWIVKIDSLGSKQWDSRFGGTGSEDLSSMQITLDGGGILGGISGSNISGDKTQDSWALDPRFTNYDYWVVKVDSLGNKQWDKTIGGTSGDYLKSIHATTDGGYILGGLSSSGISGDKTQPARGAADYWIVKIDMLGNKLWDRTFGTDSADNFLSLQQTFDGGYILGGFTISGINGDKTQSSRGYYDYWIIKTDSLGNKKWDKRFGGAKDDYLLSLQQTSDRGYIIGGQSYSSIGGDKTQVNRDTTLRTRDYWIVKIDSLGNKQWDRSFGGSNDDELTIVFQTSDGGYLIAGESSSLAGGDKSENNLGMRQSWIIKTDSLGDKQWDKTILTVGQDSRTCAIQTMDKCYIIANTNNGGRGGYKTEENWDNSRDFWVIKFCEPIPNLCSALTTTVPSGTAQVTCFGASDGAAKAVASGGTPPYSFLWSDGQTTSSPTNFPAGTYSVTVTDNSGCTASTSITIAEGPICTGVQDYLLNNISLYPNPTDGKVTIEIPSFEKMESLTLKLYDVLGRQLMDQRVESAMIQQGIAIDLKSLPGNIFFLNITTEAGSRVMKVVKY